LERGFMSKESKLQSIKTKYFADLDNRVSIITYLFMDFKSGANTPDGVKTTILLRVFESLNKLNSGEEIDPWIQLEDGAYEINFNGSKLIVKIFHDVNEEKENLWELTIESEFFIVEQLRTMLLSEFKGIFNHKYCLKDEVSFIIAKKSYKLINELENLLREYLLRFFVKKVGSSWWKINSNDKLQKKSKSYSAKRSFNGLLDMEIYNIDFVDLKELVTGNFNLTNNLDIVQALDSIILAKDEPEKIELKVNRLKEKFMGNWEKFFKDHIGIMNFDTIWEELYNIRCIVAHNSLITIGDFSNLIDKYEKIKPNLENIIIEMGSKGLSIEEKLSISVITENLEVIRSLTVMLSSNDIKTILERNQLFITMDSLKVDDKEHFFSTVDEIREELSILGEIKNVIPQGQEDGEIPIIWVEFKELEANISKVLKYGLSIEAFQADYNE
jgi:hypothetical protein